MDQTPKKRKQLDNILDGQYWGTPTGKRARKLLVQEANFTEIFDIKTSPKPKQWTLEETEILTTTISKLNVAVINWDDIAALIPNKTAKQCKAKYVSLKNANTKDIRKVEVKKSKPKSSKVTQLHTIDEMFSKMKGTEIRDGLFLGGHLVVSNQEWLREKGIQSILNITKEVKYNLSEHSVELKRIPVSDGDTDLILHLEEATSFISKSLEDKKNVLVHCKEGKSRSPSVVLAYLLNSMTLHDAYQFLREKYPRMEINVEFKRQLMEFEFQSKGEITKDFFPRGTRANPVHAVIKREPLVEISAPLVAPKQEDIEVKKEIGKENVPPPLMSENLLFS